MGVAKKWSRIICNMAMFENLAKKSIHWSIENQYRSIDISIFGRSMYIYFFDKFSNIAMLHSIRVSGSVLGPEHESDNIFFENQYLSSIDRKSIYRSIDIDFRSINVSIFCQILEHSHVAYHSGSFLALNMNPAIFFSKIDIDRPKIDISIFGQSM